jgi:flagellar assembly factor FliW
MTTYLLHTPRFGAVEYTHEDVVTFPDGMIGFAAQREYLILQHKEGSPFRWLQSIESPELAFLIVDPVHFVADYSPSVTAEAVHSIDVVEESSTLVYTVVTIPKGMPGEMTLNLAGPIVVNADKRLAKQLILDDSRWSLKHKVERKVASPTEQAA